MNLVELYHERVDVYHIEELLGRNLSNMAIRKTRSNFHSIVLHLIDSAESLEVCKFLTTRLNDLVANNHVHQLRITPSNTYSHLFRNITYELIKPFISKSSEDGQDTYIYYRPDKSVLKVNIVAMGVHKISLN